jgi:hypothetical protein
MTYFLQAWDKLLILPGLLAIMIMMGETKTITIETKEGTGSARVST